MFTFTLDGLITVLKFPVKNQVVANTVLRTIPIYIEVWCNGSIIGFDPVDVGSIPTASTICRYSTTGQYNGLLIREIQVRILLSAPYRPFGISGR